MSFTKILGWLVLCAVAFDIAFFTCEGVKSCFKQKQQQQIRSRESPRITLPESPGLKVTWI